MVERDHESIRFVGQSDHSAIKDDGFQSRFRQAIPLIPLESADCGVCSGGVEE
jgi:hypothetical protein